MPMGMSLEIKPSGLMGLIEGGLGQKSQGSSLSL